MPILQPVHLTVRMDHELAAALRDLARRSERSTSAEVRRAIRRHLADEAQGRRVEADRVSDYRLESGLEAACTGAAEVAIRKRQREAARQSGDTDAYAHATLALGSASSDVEHDRRYFVPVEPEPATPAPIARLPRRRDRRLNGGRPRCRRVTSRSAGGGSSGDPDEPEPPLRGRLHHTETAA